MLPKSIRLIAVRYVILVLIISIVALFFHIFITTYGIRYHVLHLFLIIHNVALITFLLFILFFLIKRVINPINKLTKIFEDTITNNFKISDKNKTILKNLSSFNDEISIFIKIFLKFDYLNKDYLARLQRNIKRREKLENALTIASSIQESLLPNIPGALFSQRIDLYAILEPAEKIGGDWYDFFFIDNDSLFFVLGDVSDKAVSAALFMAVVKTHISSIIEFERNPAQIVQLLNKKLRLNNPHHMFVTLFLGILNISTGELDYINAGHCTPILLQKGQQPFFLTEFYQPIVGALDNITYYSRKLMLNPEDILFIYSDGIVESKNKFNTMFSYERLLVYLEKIQPTDVKKLIKSVYKTIKYFSNRKKPRDDISMLAISLKKNAAKQESWITLPASMDSVDKLTSFIHGKLENQRPITQTRKMEILLTVEELLVNIIENAYVSGAAGLISINFKNILPGTIQVQLIDYGKPFNPLHYIQKIKISNPLRKRGYGLKFAHSLCNEMNYQYGQDRNILTLTFINQAG